MDRLVEPPRQFRQFWKSSPPQSEFQHPNPPTPPRHRSLSASSAFPMTPSRATRAATTPMRSRCRSRRLAWPTPAAASPRWPARSPLRATTATWFVDVGLLVAPIDRQLLGWFDHGTEIGRHFPTPQALGETLDGYLCCQGQVRLLKIDLPRVPIPIHSPIDQSHKSISPHQKAILPGQHVLQAGGRRRAVLPWYVVSKAKENRGAHPRNQLIHHSTPPDP